MDREQTKEIIKMVSAAYQNFKVDKLVIDTWFMVLEEYEFESVLNNLKAYIKNGNKFPPVIADLVVKPKEPKMVNDAEETRAFLESKEVVVTDDKVTKAEQEKIRKLLGIERG